ncbi:MAG: Smr/MutS family protein [Bacteroidales bacterium]
MVYPRNFENKIEFDVIRQMIWANCISQMGKELVDKMQFSIRLEEIKLLLDQTIEFKQLFDEGKNFPSQDYFDLRDELQQVKIEGTYLAQEVLFDLKTSLEIINDIALIFHNLNPKDYPNLREIGERIILAPFIIKNISFIVDDSGEIKDHASPELATIRKKIGDKEKAANRKIIQALKSAKSSGWIADDVEISIRDGRQVIPIPVSHKRRIQGLILDESSTGQTVFIEPGDVLEINNEIREFQGAERREIIRILKQFTSELRPFIPELINAYKELGLIDFIRAKAKFAIKINGNKPTLKENPLVNWNEAIHPLLYLNHTKLNKPIIPLSISLDAENRILVISGPNAGGKSVCLKSVGLLQYMVQCGLPIPVKDDSTAGIFEHIFIDIGDEQSLESDLSTYSSHLLNMKNLVLKGDDKSLFLIDEFGTGTEPQLGGAIAEAILEKLNEKKCFGVVTTHYSNLKLLARQGNGIVNGAMLFDSQKMEPLYQLVIGKPGSSFAFEIARKIGFPREILQQAEQKTGKKQLDFDEQLQQLDIEKKEIDRKKQEFQVADTFINELVKKYETLLNDLESKKKNILADAQKEAFDLINSSNKLIENTIREIKESNADKQKTKEVREELTVKKEKLKSDLQKVSFNLKSKHTEKGLNKNVEGEKKVIEKKIRVGDIVNLPEENANGEVISVNGNEVVIAFNSITLKTDLKKVEKIIDKESKKSTSNLQKTFRSGIYDKLNDKLTNFSFQLDIRGVRGEEAIEKVKQYIDDALILNMREIKILHGKGHGILRTITHDYLATVPEVKEFRDEHIERGGHGVTLVILK